MTPTNPPGAIEKDALSTAALVPKRHVKPSTTSMQCSRTPSLIIANDWIRQLCDRRATVRSLSTPEECHRSVMTLSSSPLMTCRLPDQPGSLVGIRMAGKMLSVEPTIDPSAKLHDTRLGAYCEVGARTILHEVSMDDYSYVVNDAQITYTTIGKFCSIAAMTRIKPGC